MSLMTNLKDAGKSVRWGQSLRQVGIKSRNVEHLGTDHRTLRVVVHGVSGMSRSGKRSVAVTIRCGAQSYTTTPKPNRSELEFEESFDMRVPVSTHTGQLMLKHIQFEVNAGKELLGMCLAQLAEVGGQTQEYRLMNRVAESTKPALAGHGRIRLCLEWMPEAEPSSDGSRHYGTSFARLLRTGLSYTDNLSDDSWREPPDYPQLSRRLAYPKKQGSSKNLMSSRSLSPGTSVGKLSGKRNDMSGNSRYDSKLTPQKMSGSSPIVTQSLDNTLTPIGGRPGSSRGRPGSSQGPALTISQSRPGSSQGRPSSSQSQGRPGSSQTSRRPRTSAGVSAEEKSQRAMRSRSPSRSPSPGRRIAGRSRSPPRRTELLQDFHPGGSANMFDHTLYSARRSHR